MSGHWERVKHIFGAAAELPTKERSEFLDRECGEDQDLRREVQTLLAADAETLEFGTGGMRQIIEAGLLAPGGKIGPYQLESRIGAGGMGVVYSARHEGLDRPVALKILPARWLDQRELRERFVREARVMARIRHHGIVPIHDIVETEDSAAIAMELVPGADLDRVLSAWEQRRAEPHGKVLAEVLGDDPSTPFPGTVEFLVQVCSDVAQALAAAHTAGVLHRDVKPSNIRIRAGERIGLLVDFGVARLLGDEATITAGFVGTPSYAAPEQLANRPVDERSDVFSLALTLYRATCRAAGVEHTVDGSQRLRELVPAASPDLEAVLHTALEIDPRDRYASASAFGRDLAAILDERPVVARPRGPATRAWHWVSRDRMRLSLAVIFLVATSLGLVLWEKWPNIAAGERLRLEQQVDKLLQTGYSRLFNPATRPDAAEALARAERLAPTELDALLGQLAALCLDGHLDEARAFVATRPALREYEDLLAPMLGQPDAPTASIDGAGADRLSVAAMVRYVIALRSGLDADYAAAARVLERLRFTQHKASELHLGITAYAAAQAGMRELADRAVLGLEELWGGSSSAIAWVALALADHDSEHAARAARRAIALEPDLEPALLHIAIEAEAETGHSERAMEDLDAAIARHPRAVRLIATRGWLLARQGEVEQAIAEFRRAIELAPNDFSARSALAELLWEQDPEAAIEQFTIVTELVPDLPEAFQNLGRACFMRKDYERARGAFARAVELDPDDTMSLCVLGESLYRLRDPEAITWLDRATEVDPRCMRAFYYLAAALHREGDFESALQHAERALALAEAGEPGVSIESVRASVERLREVVSNR